MTSTETTTKTNHFFRALVVLAVLAMMTMVLTAKPAHALTIFTVNNNIDPGDGKCEGDGNCTLRDAILAANNNPNVGGPDLIRFNIPGSSVHTIKPSSPLPSITDPVTIDGYSQGAFTPDPADDAKPNTLAKGTNAVLKIQLNGSNAGSGASGLQIETSQSVVKGLVINRFKHAGILVAKGQSNHIEGNFIGTDPSGTRDRGNGFAGVKVEGLFGDEAQSFIGGTTPEKHNLISGNEGEGGISILGGITRNNNVQGNLIGTSKDGITALGNSGCGVGIFGSSNNLVGSGIAGGANTIAFNGLGGVLVGNSGSTTTITNSIARNSIFSNKGLGIDLGNDGPTPNDPDDPATPEADPDSDTGPNTLLNKPVLSSAKTVSGKTTIKGTLNGQPEHNFLVQFFSNPSGNEGKRFIGLTIASTDGSGKGSFTFSPKKAVAVGKTITATTDDSSNNTSEFSAPRKVASS